MNILFRNKGILSLLDMMTMGDSVKRDDSSKIGKFDSGLKYSISILYRNGISLEILSGNSQYKFTSKSIKDELTGKVKEVICIKESRGTSEGIKEFEHITAFSPNLGYEWKTWMAIRELYSNCLDENGTVEFSDVELPYNDSDETVIIVKDNGLLTSMINNWDEYFLPKDLEYIEEYADLKIYNNPSGYLKLYKNGIMVFYDKKVKSKFCYDYLHASIDEMRMLNNKNSFDFHIMYAIVHSSNENFIRTILQLEEGYYETNLSYTDNFSSTWISIINNIFQEKKFIGTFKNLFQAFMECKFMEVGVKKIQHTPSSYSWNNEIRVEKVINKEITFEDTIKKIAKDSGFEVKYPIEEGRMSGFNCIADVDDKIIYVTRNFKSEDMWQLVKAQFRIEGDDDPNYVYKQYVTILK